MRITLHGVRGSMPAPGREYLRVGGHTSCVSVTLTGEASPTLVLDAGTGLTHLSRTLGHRPFHGEIVLTHLHWDHVQGLPFFRSGDTADADVVLHLPAQDAPPPPRYECDDGVGRGAPRQHTAVAVDVPAPTGTTAGPPIVAPFPSGGGAEPEKSGSAAAALLGRAMSPPHFPIGPEGLAGRWRFRMAEAGWLEAGGARVLLTDIPHKGGRTFGIRVEADGASFAYLPDHDPSADPAPGATLAHGVDVLLHDAQFAESERAIAVAYGHSTVADAVALAIRADVGRLVLIHHAPTRTDDAVDALAAREAADAEFPVTIGRERDVIDL
ncbi:MBL fold metallo-hydrolase [Phytoactinopolyspora halotolerans]|uniref:Metallo-beta-lactamase domain-containing protein n=1 Tax=Phytoactinopolyspora halotolerans TaxID=1981512 RepID=A0A6L9S470_9ACTN|nr:MBL fold metallo-hydrolase [Phytoactinopolyspora halotolerans]NED99935.1 hypothetical protein [Phytoactinopolyspora halotolerans]